MKKVLLFLLTLLPLFVSGQVKRTIHVETAGTLPTLISGEEKYEIEELTLSGELNGTDFKFIRDMAGVIDEVKEEFDGDKIRWVEYLSTEGILKSINLAESKIVSGGIPYYLEGDRPMTGTAWIEKYYTESDAISSYLFARTKLETIILPNSITSIGACVFYNCNYLTSITIPKNVTEISNGAFTNSIGLTSIIVESGNQNYDSRNNCNAIVDNNNQLIAGCKNTIIPNSVTSIGSSAFSGCSGLTSITISNSVMSIETSAFESCSGLNTVTIANGLKSIGEHAFSGCSGLTSITIPNSVTSIGEHAFHYCNGLTSIKVENGNPQYDSRNDCNAIIDKNNQLVVGCKNTIIPNSVTSIGDYAFSYCNGLTSIIIPDNVTSIGNDSFYYCTGLIYVTLSSKLKSIGSGAFFACFNLTDVYCYAETVPSVYPSSFPNRSNITLYVTLPYSLRVEYESSESWSGFKAYQTLYNSDTQSNDKCSKPTINIVDGKVTFESETPEVAYHWYISLEDGTKGTAPYIRMPITINVYATKNGYQNSEVATYMFSGLVGDVDGDGLVNVADHVKLSEIIMNQ